MMSAESPSSVSPRSGLGRRDFLGLSAAAIAAGAASAQSLARSAPMAPVAPARRPGKARNVIFMVADGMSFGTLTLADMFRRQHDQRPSHWISLFARPDVRRGLYATHSADSLVTDSAAAASAWAIGKRVNNSVINIDADGKLALPILAHAAQNGRRTGLVTTTRLTHATPAAFIANIPRRDWEKPIAQQMLDRKLDVGLGGGSIFFHPEMLAAAPQVQVVRDRAALLAATERPASGKRLLGLFADSHVPFEIERPATVPTLAEMTRAALRHLQDSPEGFVLQVEGGRVDHAAHSNDAPSLVRDQVAFDDAIAEVLRFLNIDGGSSRRDDTLLIITSDHGNANPGLTLYGQEARSGFDRLAKATHSFEWIGDRLNVVPPRDRAEAAPRLVAEATGVEFDAEQKQVLSDALAAKRVAPFIELSKFEQVLGGLLANTFGISFISGNHTSDYVEVTALGPGSDDLRPVGHNTDLHELMVASLALATPELLPDMKDPIVLPTPPKPD